MYGLFKLFESTCKYSHSKVSAIMILLASQSTSSEYTPESSLELHFHESRMRKHGHCVLCTPETISEKTQTVHV